MEWMILPLKRYAEFSGRSRRKEYWMFFLFTIIVSIVLGIIDGVLGLTVGANDGSAAARMTNTGVLGGLFSLATIVPSIAVGVRRLHDIDRRGWWLLMPIALLILGLVLGGALGGAAGGGMMGLGAGFGLGLLGAIVGGIVLLVFYCLEGTRGPNRFGPDPKDPAGTADLNEVFR